LVFNNKDSGLIMPAKKNSKAKNNNGAIFEFESQLWVAADKLRRQVEGLFESLLAETIDGQGRLFNAINRHVKQASLAR